MSSLLLASMLFVRSSYECYGCPAPPCLPIDASPGFRPFFNFCSLNNHPWPASPDIYSLLSKSSFHDHLLMFSTPNKTSTNLMTHKCPEMLLNYLLLWHPKFYLNVNVMLIFLLLLVVFILHASPSSSDPSATLVVKLELLSP